MSRGSSRRGGYRSRFGFQENDRVQASGERDRHFGSWDGDPDSIPGAQNADGSPDMRDDVNREAFLGETVEDRSFQRAANIVRGSIARGNDPQELLEVAQQEPVTGRYTRDQGRRDYEDRDRGRSQVRGGGRDYGDRDRGESRDYDRDRERGGSRRDDEDRGGRSRAPMTFREKQQQYGRGDDPRQVEDVCRHFEQDHQAEEDGLGRMRDILNNARGRLGDRDLDDLDRICRESLQISDNERKSIRQIEQSSRDRRVGDLCDEACRANDNEYRILKDLMRAIQQGDGRRIEDLCSDLEEVGRTEGEVFNEMETALMDQSGAGSGGSSRGGTSSRRPGTSRGGGEEDFPRNKGGEPDLRDDRNRERYIEQRGGTSIHDRSRGGRPQNVDGSRDLRDPENRREYLQERGYSGRQPRDD